MSEKRKLTQVEQDRMEELKQELRALQDKEAEEEDPKEDEEPMDEPKDDKEDEPSQEEEEPMDEDPKEEEDKIEKNACAQDKEKKSACVQDKEDKENKRTLNIKSKKMNKEFRLLKAIADIANNRQMDDVALAVSEAGREEMRANGLSYGGQIQIPIESRAAITVAAEGEDTVATNLYNVMEPLRAKNVMVAAGAKFLTNLTGDVQIPLMSPSNCGWEGEIAEAKDGAGTFSSVKLSPRRLTCFIDLSKQFLIQDSVGAEEMLRADIVNSLVAKLEQTIFGDAAGDTTKPAGIFNSAEVVAPSYQGVCAAEAAVTDYSGEKRFVMSPTAKSAFKQATISGTKSDLRLLLEDGEVDGYPVSDSSNVVAGGYAFGDFSELVVAQWGGIDIVVDPYTLATKNAIRLVINAYFDAKVRRNGAIKAYKIA